MSDTILESAPPPSAPPAPEPLGSPVVDTYIPKEVAGEKVWDSYRGKPIGDVLKSFVDSHKYATGAIKLPGEKDKPEEAQAKLKEIYGKLGRPESADKYTVKAPALPEGVQWDAGRETQFKTVAHALNLTTAQVQGLLDWYGTDVSSSLAEHGKTVAQSKLDAEQQLKQEWGGAYAQNVALAERSLQSIAEGVLTKAEATAFLDLMTTSGMGRNPAFIKMMANLGPMLGDDRLVHGDRPTTDDSLQHQIDTLMESDEYQKAQHPRHEAAVAQMLKLHQQMINPMRKAMQEA